MSKVSGEGESSSPKHQVWALREYKGKPRPVWFEKNLRFDSLEDILEDPDTFLEKIPKNERYNVFFTMGKSNDKTRSFDTINHIWFDIDFKDVLDSDTARRTYEVACQALDLDPDEVSGLMSGHGVQIFVRLEDEVTVTDDFFNHFRDHYINICRKIDNALGDANIPFEKVDTSVFSNARLMRFPETLNRKKSKKPAKSFVLSPGGVAQNGPFGRFLEDFYAQTKIAPSTTQGTQAISIEAWMQHESIDVIPVYPEPDTEAIKAGCELIKSVIENPGTTLEPQWYDAISILARAYGSSEEEMSKAKAYIHEISRPHPGYSEHETNEKIKHALEDTGPITCKVAHERQGAGKSSKCTGCKHFANIENKIKFSPILIKSEEHIGTEKTYFRRPKENGRLGVPHYNDLLKAFSRDYIYKYCEDTKDFYYYEDGLWLLLGRSEILKYCNDKCTPPGGILDTKKSEREEFIEHVRLRELTNYAEFFLGESIASKTNLLNGVYDWNTNKLLEHGPEFGFTWKLPFSFDPEATCPETQGFIKWFTCNDKGLEQSVWEMMGYILSGDEYWEHKIFMLCGSGRNGKGVLMRLLTGLIGKENCSSVKLEQLIHDQYSLITLNHKIANFAGETSAKAIENTAILKELSGEDTVMANRKNKPHVHFVNRAKLLFSVNELGYIADKTEGFFERFFPIPCNAHISSLERKIEHYERKLLEEAPGIFNKAIRHYQEMKKRGTIYKSDAVQKVVEQKRVDDDSIFAWISEGDFREKFKVHKEGLVETEAVYFAYQDWCHKEERQAHNKIQFSKRLLTHLAPLDRRISFDTTKRRNSEGKSARHYIGLSQIKATPGQFTNGYIKD